MIFEDSFKNKHLKTLFSTGSSSKIQANWRAKILQLLDTLDQAEKPEDLDLPGYGFHELKGKRLGFYSLKVNKNWRLTFGWDDDYPINIDLEDYH